MAFSYPTCLRCIPDDRPLNYNTSSGREITHYSHRWHVEGFFPGPTRCPKNRIKMPPTVKYTLPSTRGGHSVFTTDVGSIRIQPASCLIITIIDPNMWVGKYAAYVTILRTSRKRQSAGYPRFRSEISSRARVLARWRRNHVRNEPPNIVIAHSLYIWHYVSLTMNRPTRNVHIKTTLRKFLPTKSQRTNPLRRLFGHTVPFLVPIRGGKYTFSISHLYCDFRPDSALSM